MVSITDELREWAGGFYSVWVERDGAITTCNVQPSASSTSIEDFVCGVADRIDAAHRSALEKLAAQLDESEDGWVRLPVDADGEVVRVGDVMVMASHPFGCEDKPLVVDRMELSRGMHGEVWCLALDTDRSCWTQAAVLRHHHEPTVEDVLRQFAREIDADAYGITDAKVAEFAAKLRLAEGVDE